MPRFGRPGTYTVDGSPIGIRAASIDSQAGLDLVTANEAGEEGPSLSMLFNRGLGSFFPEKRMSLSAANYILQAVAAGDFNADGRDDLALAVDDISVFPIRAEVLVLRNTGDGQFAAPAGVPAAGTLSALHRGGGRDRRRGARSGRVSRPQPQRRRRGADDGARRASHGGVAERRLRAASSPARSAPRRARWRRATSTAMGTPIWWWSIRTAAPSTSSTAPAASPSSPRRSSWLPSAGR